jgi:hypothetical protein
MYKLFIGFLLAIVAGVLCWSSPALAQDIVSPLHEFAVSLDRVAVFDSAAPGEPLFYLMEYEAIFLLDSAAATVQGTCVRRLHYKSRAGTDRVGIVRCDKLTYVGETTTWHKYKEKTYYVGIYIDSAGLGARTAIEAARVAAAKTRASAAIARTKSRPGLNDIHLGMSRGDIEDLAASSPLTFAYDPATGSGDLWMEGIEHRYSAFDSQDSTHIKLLGVLCSGYYCEFPGSVELRFFHDTLFAIHVNSTMLEQEYAGLAWSWASGVTGALKASFGKPKRFNKKLEDMAYERYKDLPPGTHEVSAWSLKNDVSIDVAVKVEDTKLKEPFHSYVHITDGKIAKRMAAEGQ